MNGWVCPGCQLRFSDYASLVMHRAGPDMAECCGREELLAYRWRLERSDRPGVGRQWRMPQAWRDNPQRSWVTDLIRLADIADQLLDVLRVLQRCSEASATIAGALDCLFELMDGQPEQPGVL